ncbi:DUF126 domain-containing protein [candidate division KSB1 bacterium]|nr:DUF126 domain-containing protein [candidate division KSB1 bacterium]
MEILTGRSIYEGQAKGEVLRSDMPIGFFGHVDLETGIIKEPGHPLEGQSIAGKVIVFPTAKGSTVGSYILYALKKRGKAPLAFIMKDCELIVAVGAIISEIVGIDQVDITKLHTGDWVSIEGNRIVIEQTHIY